MSLVDPWGAILSQLCPEYDQLKSMLEKNPRILANLSQRGRKWVITIKEEIPSWSENNYRDAELAEEWNNVIHWTNEQLENQTRVRRMAYDMWFFDRKSDALKFQTFYHLRWA